MIQPTFIFDYPAEFSPLAKRKPDDSSVAESFELCVIGYRCQSIVWTEP